MTGKSHILAIDQGTTGSTALLFDEKGRVLASVYREIQQIYPLANIEALFQALEKYCLAGMD